MNADNAGDEESQSERDEPVADDQHELVVREGELAQPETDLVRQNPQTVRTVADAVQSQSQALQSVKDMAQSSGLQSALESAAATQRAIADAFESRGFQAVAEWAANTQTALRSGVESRGFQTMAESAANTQRLAEVLADSPAFRMAAELGGSWQRFMTMHTAGLSKAIRAMKVVSRQIPSWTIEFAATASRTLQAVHQAAAPPNWPVGDTMTGEDYPTAITLSFEEGIPLAWVPDTETVQLLLAVPTGPEGRTKRREILADRRPIILNHCQAQVDALANDPDTAADQQRLVEVARQSIQALRADLPAPAQAAAANLVDQLMRRLIYPIDGKYAYKAASQKVTDLTALTTVWSFRVLAFLRELATLMPVPKSLTEWWPNKGMALPDSFSRHTTAHAIAEPDQVNPVNALIAIMLAVSLLRQETASGWTALGANVWNTDADVDDTESGADA